MTDEPIDLYLPGGARVDADDPSLCGDCMASANFGYCLLPGYQCDRTRDRAKSKWKRTPACLEAERMAREMKETIETYRQVARGA